MISTAMTCIGEPALIVWSGAQFLGAEVLREAQKEQVWHQVFTSSE